MKKAKKCALSMAIVWALVINLFGTVAFAVEENPLQANVFSIFADDLKLAGPGEYFHINSDSLGEVDFPISILYGDVLYLSLFALMEAGIDVNLTESNTQENPRLDIQQSEPVGVAIPRKAERKFTLSDIPEDQYNLFDIYIDNQQIAKAGQNLEIDGHTYPSSFMIIPYLPVQYILQQLGIRSYFNKGNLTFSILYNNPNNAGIFNFTKDSSYTPGQFADVPSSTWYSDSVKAAFEYGLMVGNGETFNPSGNISVAEAITIAARLHNTYYSRDFQFLPGTPWYQAYVEYALQNELLVKPYDNYIVPITRSDFAIIMANIFPLPAINEVEDWAIPDIKPEDDCYEAAYRLYRAGIISGTDTKGTFNPTAQITRAEVSVILSNMVDSGLRKTFTLEAPPLPVSISMDEKITLPLGTERAFFASDPDVRALLSWSSANSDVATVEDGVITAVGVGTTTITARTFNGVSATCTVTVQTQEDIDLKYAKDALERLKSKAYFPDTLEIYGIWAGEHNIRCSHGIEIGIYCSALSSAGLRRRNEQFFLYNLDTGEFLFDMSTDSVAPHTDDRKVNIDMSSIDFGI